MQVQRTLVKSPPELWAEVSDVDALTRHLARFGEISITRVEPESKVAWEGEHASGTVELTASGWGTKVTLTADAPPPEPVAVELTSHSDANSTSTAEPRRRWLRFWRRPAATAPEPAAPPPEPAPAPPPFEAVLTQVLDDLGQAHHRPFSR